MFVSSINLVSEVEKLWHENKVNVEKNLDKWLYACKDGESKIRNARKEFHQWNPLKVYVSVDKAKLKKNFIFSLRFFGQEVAELFVKDKFNLMLHINKNHKNNNEKYFKNNLKEGKYFWNSKEAKDFRAFFKKLIIDQNGTPKIKSTEHRIESKFIEEMLKGSGKFGQPGIKIQPIKLGGCPLQFPIPFAANTGKPLAKTGHIDILARRKAKNNKTRLSVWELKRPNTYKKAASQAFIYALQLLKILRSDKGNEWYNLFGFTGKVPKSLEVEAVVAITANQKNRFDFEKENFVKNEINGDVIKLYAVYYEEQPRAIRFLEDSFRLD